MQWEPLRRYPHEGTYTDEFWGKQESDEESSMAGSEMHMGSETEGSDDANLARPEASG